MTAQTETIAAFYNDRWAAHQFFFPHRHPDESPRAHAEIVERIHSPDPRYSFEGFRGLGKTTLLEEGVTLRAAFGEFRYCIIVSANYRPLAIQRIATIKNEIEVNRQLEAVFGNLRGPIWQEGMIVLANGACIQAIGRDMSVAGLKYLSMRPDALMVDDVEDPQEVRTDIEREATWKWFQETLLPSLDDPLNSWARALGTRRGKGSLPERLEDEGWPTLKVPIEYIDDKGERRATWPTRRPLPWIDKTRHDYRGDMHVFMQEYMCQSSSEQHRVFSRSALKCEPRPRPPWQAVYAMYDPARTAHRTSASTGIAVWSWIGSRLIFWRAEAQVWLPDQIIADMFDLHRRFQPVWMGFEEDGLNEWAKQPIRAEMIKRGAMLPLLPVRAPRGKLDFIRGLQPYVQSGELTFAGPPEDFAEAIDQFLSFPHGRIDAPNACAYALLLRPGLPVYDNFTEANVVEGLQPAEGKPLYLAGNSDGAVATAVLMQRTDGELRILADWVREGSPADVAADIHAEASLGAETADWQERVEYGEGEEIFKLPVRRVVLTRIPVKWVVPSWHRETYRNVGLVQAIRAMPAGVGIGSENGQSAVRTALGSLQRGKPRFLVSDMARWTLRALSGGYAKSVDRRGLSAPQPAESIYRLLMEGVEAFAAVGAVVERTEDDQQPIAFNRQGVPYRSAMPQRGRGS